MSRATQAAKQALAHMSALGQGQTESAQRMLKSTAGLASLPTVFFEQLLSAFWSKARICIHFHPDRLDVSGRSVAAGLLAAGYFKTQFDTGISAGSPTAFSGGERDIWERDLFGGAYHTAETALVERPKYGALHVLGYPDGPAPRFGSCYFVLKPEVCHRASYTYGGSQAANALTCSGTRAAFLPVLIPLLTSLARGTGALGDAKLDLQTFYHRLCDSDLAIPLGERPLGHALDDYIEAQIHGPLNLTHDAEALVADPCFRDGPLKATLQALCDRYQLRLEWHPGFTLPLADVPLSFRGYAEQALAEQAAKHGHIDAASLGQLENRLRSQPEIWPAWGGQEQMLTRFRRLWHILVLFGQPR